MPPVLLKNPDLLFSSPSGPGTPPVLQPNPVLLFFPPAPPPPCRGLTPHRSLKWPAREGGLAFGAHQARSSSAARFTGLTEKCHTTNQSQENTCLTMLCNECCVGYWKAGALCLGRLADFGRGISRRIVPKRNPTFRWRLGPRGGLQSWKGIEWARGGQADFSDLGR